MKNRIHNATEVLLIKHNIKYNGSWQKVIFVLIWKSNYNSTPLI